MLLAFVAEEWERKHEEFSRLFQKEQHSSAVLKHGLEDFDPLSNRQQRQRIQSSSDEEEEVTLHCKFVAARGVVFLRN